jgi:hypothetical protein
MLEAAHEIETEGNYENFKLAVIPSLKTIEGFLWASPNNTNLLGTLTKGYAAAGFGLYEVNIMRKKYADEDKNIAKINAESSYSKSIRYGFRYLEQYGISFLKLKKIMKSEGAIAKFLDDKLKVNDLNLNVIFFLGQSMASMMNLNRKDIFMLSYLSVAKDLIDWTCLKEPNFQYGSCQVFNGYYLSSKPKMLGGDFAAGKKLFLEAIKSFPENLNNIASYLQFYVIPMGNEEEYQIYKTKLLSELKKFNQNLKWNPDEEKYLGSPLALLNAIAAEKLNIMIKYEDDLF